MSILEEIKDFADKAHGEQMRKYSPDRYIVHPVRVMNLCREYTDDETMLAAALLHDVLEDTPVTAQQILDFLLPLMGSVKAKRTVKLVEELTDVYIKKDYPQWNRRKRKEEERKRMKETSADSQTIKYADIIDNCVEIVNHDPSFARVFLNECLSLLKVMTKGNPVLYKRAIDALAFNRQLLSNARTVK